MKHFSDVANCDTTVSEASLERLLVVSPCLAPTNQVPGDDSDSELCDELSEKELGIAISQLRNGRDPGVDEISAELLKLGSAESI